MIKQIVDYKIVIYISGVEEFNIECSRLINEGYEPLGDLKTRPGLVWEHSTGSTAYPPAFAQVFAKYELHEPQEE